MSLPASHLATTRPVGELLRDWRQRRRMSQLDLACEADISTRHLSFVETGRAQPSREMLLHLAERLNVPLRERNALLIAAGFAPMFAERSLDDPALKAARAALDLVLRGHEPYPALAVDRHWNLVAMNRAVGAFMDGIAPELLQPPVNVLRLALHPGGLAPRIVNLVEWRAHLIARLHQQIAASADPGLDALMRELCDYPVPGDGAPHLHTDYAGVIVPLKLKTPGGVLSFFSTITVFGTPVDITLSELALEAFFPADAATAAALRRLGDGQTAAASA
ncbi:helix-turn-helix domain-containing protein [Ideonella sp. BN130291]|uniref:helix-turn-helix domain-containing protein n=1 Tax=Ideonella sp. BN130291 TaxID=3112940 RepID=UPI002E27517A|nr:helix-turn-helix transcriptional regulator [Ideonella sp. BN130291]